MAIIDWAALSASIIKYTGKLALKELKRQECVIRLLTKFGFDPDTPPTDFKGLYAYALIKYGLRKPEIVLEFLRHPEVRMIFRSGFDEDDLSATLGKVRVFVEQDKLGDKLKEQSIDPDMVIEEFSEIFELLASKSSSPNQKLHQRDTKKILKGVDELLQRSQVDANQTATYHSIIDISRNLIDEYKPTDAIKLLEELKSKIWATADDHVKFRILTNMGASELNLRNTEAAIGYFEEAFNYEPDKEKALENMALAQLLKEEHPQAIEYANKTLKLNPKNENAYYVIIRASENTSSIDELIDLVPEELRSHPLISSAIGQSCMNKLELAEAAKWLSLAGETKEKYKPDIISELAKTIFTAHIDNHAANPATISLQQSEKLTSVVDYCDQLWSMVGNTEMAKYYITALSLKALSLRLLGKIDEAKSTIEILCKYPDLERDHLVAASIIYMGSNELAKAENTFNKLKTFKTKNDIIKALMHLQLLMGKQNYEKAISAAKKYIHSASNDSETKTFIDLLTEAFIRSKNYSAGIRSLKSRLKTENLAIHLLANISEIERARGKTELAKEYTLKAFEKLSKDSPVEDQLTVAKELYELKLYNEAVAIFESAIDVRQYNDYLVMLVYCYINLKNFRQALDICKKIRNAFGVRIHLIEAEIFINEHQDDIRECIKLVQLYLDQHPDNLRIKIQKEYYSARLGDPIETDKFEEIDIYEDNLSLETAIQLSRVYALNGEDYKALKVLFDTRRKYIDNGEAHKAYFGFFFYASKKLGSQLQAEEVANDTAVLLEEDNGKKTWYVVVEPHSKVPPNTNEISPTTNALAQKLMGKKVGDEITLVESKFDRTTAKIRELHSKYVFAFNDSLARLVLEFGDSSITRVPLNFSGDVEKDREVLINILEKIDDGRQEAISENMQNYLQGKMPFGGFCRIAGRDFYNTYLALISDQDTGIKCCAGNANERQVALKSLLRANKTVVMDLTALFTTCQLGLFDVLPQVFPRILVTQSTFDSLKEILFDLEGPSSEGFDSISHSNGQIFLRKVSREDVAQIKANVQSIVDWISANCEICPRSAVIDFSVNDVELYETVLGTPLFDSILASNPEYILYSDDLITRSLATSQNKCGGVWTQIILMHCLQENILTGEEYDHFVIKLAGMNYNKTSIMGLQLFKAARLSGWNLAHPYSNLLNQLINPDIDIKSLIPVISVFIIESIQQTIIPPALDRIIFDLLDKIIKMPNGRSVYKAIKQDIFFKLEWSPYTAITVKELLQIWERTVIL